MNSRRMAAGRLLSRACSGRLRKSEGSLLRHPVRRNIKTAGPQCMRGKLRRLTACHNPLHHLGRQKRQTYEPADVLLADSVAPGDLDHRSASAAHEVVEPAVCSRHRSVLESTFDKLVQVKNAADRMRLEYLLLGSRMSLEERRRFDAYCVADTVDD